MLDQRLLPPPFLTDSKNGEPRHIPMDTTVVDLLTTYPRNPTSDLLFTNETGGKLKDIRQGIGNTRRRAGLVDLRFHDLRHAFASQWMMAGGDLYISNEILGAGYVTWGPDRWARSLELSSRPGSARPVSGANHQPSTVSWATSSHA